jgi:hypothetical protein
MTIKIPLFIKYDRRYYDICSDVFYPCWKVLWLVLGSRVYRGLAWSSMRELGWK